MEERIIIATDEEIDLTIPKDYEEYDNNFDISLIEVSGVYEDFSQDAYIQTLTLNVKIKY